MSQLAKEILKKAKEEKATFVDLGNCWLESLPDDLFNEYFIENLIGLNLGNFYNYENKRKYSVNNWTQNWINETDLSRLSIFKNLSVFYYGDSGGSLTSMSFVSELKKLKILDLSFNHIKKLEGLNENKNLQELYLRDNRISKIEELEESKKLKILSLRNNHISKIEGLDNNKNLKSIDLSFNLIRNIEPLIPLLKRENNPLEIVLKDSFDFSEHQVNIFGNYLDIPPMGIVMQGNEAVLNYFKQLEKYGKDYMYEAKMLIVGEGASGKTTLAHKIENPDCALPHIDDRTRGISINVHKFNIKDKKGAEREFRLNVWDFGGQEMYHSTHRFFLSERSIYVLVSDNRKGDTDFNYWLNIIEMYAGKSPVIIVLNEKDDVAKAINQSDLKGRYHESIKEIVPVNFKTFEEADKNKKRERLDKIKMLIKKIEQNAGFLIHIEQEIPARWNDIRTALEDDTRNYMYREQFDEICEKKEVTDIEDINTILSFFHDLGIVLNFKDNQNLKNRVLKPAWATNAVYKIFDHETIKSKKGRFTRDDCKAIWSDRKFKNMDAALLELMKNFKLVYEINNTGKLVAPQMLPNNKPEYKMEYKNNSIMEYRYSKFMPQGILWDFIIRMYRYIENQDLVWKEGIVLNRNQTQAEIIENINHRIIYIRFSGNNIPEFRSIISDELDEINKSYFNLECNKMIPCICSKCKDSRTPFLFNFDNIYKRKQAGKMTVECDESFENVQVLALLEGFGFKEKPKKIFISYAHKDGEEWKDKLKDQLSSLRNQESNIRLEQQGNRFRRMGSEN